MTPAEFKNRPAGRPRSPLWGIRIAPNVDPEERRQAIIAAATKLALDFKDTSEPDIARVLASPDPLTLTLGSPANV